MKRLLTTALLGLVAGASFASSGQITGQILDPEGKPVRDATVTVTARQVELQQSSETDRKGRYTIQLVDATREFDIRIEKQGYVTVDEPIHPKIGGVLRKDFVLQPRSIAAEVEESAEIGRLKSRDKAAKAYNAGADAYEAGDLDTAAAKIREALELEPELQVAWASLAKIELEREQWAAAAEAARHVQAYSPEDSLGLRMEYDALWGAGRRDEAEAILERLIEMGATESAAVRMFNIGIEAVKTQDWDRARASFQRTIELDPSIAPAYLTLSQIQVNHGYYTEALANAERYEEMSPGDARALQVVVNAYRGLGDVEKAEAALARMRALDPQMVAVTLLAEGQARFNNGDVAKATEALLRALEAAPDHPKVHYMLGLCYASTNRPEEAKAMLARFLELAPDDPEAELARQMLAGL